MSAAKKPTQSNLELYRIIVMMAIVAHHYVVNSGLYQEISQNPTATQSLYYYLFGMWGKTGINCFVMITGWFMCKSEITLRKFAKLLLEVELYKIIIGTIFFLTGRVDTAHYVVGLLPFRNVTDGFVGCFLLFYLTIPFLNILIRNMSKKQHAMLLLLMLFIYSFWAMLPKVHVGTNYVIWFSIIYLIASYMRIYGVYKDDNLRFWTMATTATVVASMASVIVMIWLFGIRSPYYFVSDSNHIMAVVVAICSFMMFKNLPIGYVRWINVVGASTFGVLLIHANSDAMRQWLWRETVDCAGHYGTWLYPLIAVLVVFAACIAIDWLRIRFIEQPLFRLIDKRKVRFF